MPTPDRSCAFLGCAATFLILSCSGGKVLAQSATPGTTMLKPVVVEADVREPLERRFDALPGGAARVSREELPDSANLTIARTLETVPGVVVQNFFGGNDQPRIQIRGSGLQQNPVERGILVLQDGLPLNRADGSYIVGLANPGLASSIEIYRGYMANRLGATVLGGAMNLVSPNGAEQPGFGAEISAGSFDQRSAVARAGFAGESMDGMLQAGHDQRDGFRDYNQSRRDSFEGNVAWQLSERVKTRLFVGYTDLDFDVSGPITKAQLKADPSRVHDGPTVTPEGAINPGPDVLHDRPGRRSESWLIGSRTSIEFGAHLWDVVLGYTHTDDVFRFPMASGERVTRGGDATGVLRYAWRGDAERALPLFEFTTQYIDGSADRENYLNAAGERGALFGESRLSAETLTVHAGFNIPLGEHWSLAPGLDYSSAKRRNDDRYTAATRPTIAYNPANPAMQLPNGAVPAVSTRYARSYDGWSPSLALTFQPDPHNTFFAALSRSFEPPTHDDLLATVNGTPYSSAGRPQPPNPGLVADVFRIPALKAQKATTAELGWRADHESFGVDAVVYRSEVRNELLSLRDESGSSLGAINADKTIHSGIELGARKSLGKRTRARLVWTWQDFHFDNDPLRGDNDLAGAPRQIITAALDHELTGSWSLQGVVRWIPERTPVDNMNTVWSDSWAVTDLRTRYRFNDNLTLFAEVTNLFDRKYAASTLVVDLARPDQAAFIPGDGRGAFVGLKLRL
ncbi:ligand-gated channel [Steroidobacter denitrificans]|uniref:Ligand-gated channel n=1 Tax=Steroidobacter denitrificans TaxID=465721 RepID=A0A127FE03_STEDE|nr:ligand-gated channel [Steroidobacter denitrificans]